MCGICQHVAARLTTRHIVKYLSNATSTFILRIERAHYRLVWAALTFMDRVPVRNGTPCTFRVVRVSGTIRKSEAEAVRQAKQLILAAKDAAASQDGGILKQLVTRPDPAKDLEDVTMFDIEDHSEDDEDKSSDEG